MLSIDGAAALEFHPIVSKKDGMSFVSIPFLVFFLVLYGLYWSRFNAGVTAKKRLLLLASAFFYGWWSLPFLLHFLFWIGLNYSIYYFVDRPGKKALIVLIALNLIHLGFFKYAAFFLTLLYSGEAAWSYAGDPASSMLLPLGISFYTFQIVAYHIDRHRGAIFATSLQDFALFILFFPQLIAGPIMRHNEFLPFLHRPIVLRLRDLDKGMFLVLIGVAKKALIADTLSPIVDNVFDDPESYDSASVLLAAYAFAVQIYADFSGYSDIARGLALSLGFHIPVNFRAPFFASGFQDFWRRWHITLSEWLRDYLYIPLGGNRISGARTHWNLMITMLAGGLWHGANTTFLLWGFLHGLYLIIERLYRRFVPAGKGAVYRAARTAIVFHAVLLAWIVFRSVSVQNAWSVITSFLTNEGTRSIAFSRSVASCFLAILVITVYEYRPALFLFVWRWRRVVLPAATVIIGFLLMAVSGKSAPFIYFQF